MKKSAKNSGGPKKRETTPVLVRMNPKLAKWLEEAATEAGVSRSYLMERWLAVLEEQVGDLEDTAASEGAAAGVHFMPGIDGRVGAYFFQAVLSLGILSDTASGFVRESRWRDMNGVR
jgi:hypothetical protein